MIPGERYVYDAGTPMLRVGYFIGMVKKPIPSWDEDIKYADYYTFASKPTKQLVNKHNDYVLKGPSNRFWSMTEITPEDLK